ncbi:MAG: hypothetical protein R3E77_11125 [Steroidobacteraceae bacterium]
MNVTARAHAVDRTELIVRSTFARFDIRGLATATGLVAGALILVATATLLITAPPDARHIGPHLALLANYFPGFSVTWPGALLGFLYGFVLGFAIGTTVGFSWNLAHYIFVVRAIGRFGQTGNL